MQQAAKLIPSATTSPSPSKRTRREEAPVLNSSSPGPSNATAPAAKKRGRPSKDKAGSANGGSAAVLGTPAIAHTGTEKRAVLQGDMIDLAGGTGKGFVVGARIPKDYFLTKGFGETDSGGGIDPWETGSYDIALEMAQIENFNVLQYTSLVPPESREISIEEAMPTFHHGAVLETIMAVMHGVQGDRISAGVGRGFVRRKSDGKIIGGYAAEYKGHAKASDVEAILHSDLNNIFCRRYKEGEYEMVDENFTTIVHEVKKGYGTVLAAICFSSYIMPCYDA